MYIKCFIWIKAQVSVLYKTPRILYLSIKHLLPIPSQDSKLTHTCTIYVCRSSTPAVSATVHTPDLASSYSDTVSKNDRKSSGWGLFSRTFCHMESQMNTHLSPDIRRSFPPTFFHFPSKLWQLLENCQRQDWRSQEEQRSASEFQTTQLLQNFSASSGSVYTPVRTMIEWVALLL